MKRTNIVCEPIVFLWTSPRHRPTKRLRLKRNSGFTLLEILTAMFIMAVVVSLVFASFNSIFSSADHINTSSDLFEMGSACLDRITTDLKAIHVSTYPRYRPPDIDDDPELYRVEGESIFLSGKNVSKLRFASLAHLPLNQEARQGIAEIVYYVQQNQDGALSLHRADHLYPYPDFEPDPNDPVLCEQLVTFKLSYFDHKGEELDEWNSESDDMDYSTPSAIGIELAMGPEATPMIFAARVTLPTFRFKPTKR